MIPRLAIASHILLPEMARLLNEGKDVRFTPSGVSMRPFIEGDKDSVTLSPLKRAPRRGDILLAHATAANGEQVYVLHRLVRIEDRLVLQGDGNLSGEETCTREDILGIVIAIIRPNGRKKCLSNGRLWYLLKPFRPFLLKIYRHIIRL